MTLTWVTQYGTVNVLTDYITQLNSLIPKTLTKLQASFDNGGIRFIDITYLKTKLTAKTTFLNSLFLFFLRV